MKKRFYPNSFRNERCVSRRIIDSDAKYILTFKSPLFVRYDSAGFYETFIPCTHGIMCITCRSFDRLRHVVLCLYSLRYTSNLFGNSITFLIRD